MTWAEPSSSALIADTPCGEIDQCASNPSALRKPPDMVEISGE
jgi:hypothetical protein